MHLKWAWSWPRMIHKKKKSFYKFNQILRRFIYGLFLQHVIGKVKVLNCEQIDYIKIFVKLHIFQIHVKTWFLEIIVKLMEYLETMCFHEKKFWSKMRKQEIFFWGISSSYHKVCNNWYCAMLYIQITQKKCTDFQKFEFSKSVQKWPRNWLMCNLTKFF